MVPEMVSGKSGWGTVKTVSGAMPELKKKGFGGLFHQGQLGGKMIQKPHV